jgi:hypothetical protein
MSPDNSKKRLAACPPQKIVRDYAPESGHHPAQ